MKPLRLKNVFSFPAGLWYHFPLFNPKPKTSIMKIFLLSLLAAMTASAQIVFVDMDNLIERHPRTATGTAMLKERVVEIEAEVAKERAGLKKFEDDYRAAVQEAQSPALNAAAKKRADDAAEAKGKELEERLRQAQERIQLRQQQFAKDEEDLFMRVTKDIRENIEMVAKKKGYKAVLPKTIAIYADDSLDITEEIAKAMSLDPLPADAKVRSTTIFP